MLGASATVRTLGLGDAQEALAVCAQDPVTNVFVAARILEGGLLSGNGVMLGGPQGEGSGLCWAGANVVPVQCDPETVGVFADAIHQWRRWVSSLFGPADSVLRLWELLEPRWGAAREVRSEQPVLTMAESPLLNGVEIDSRVRPAHADEVDIVLPAAAAMFTEEIGYPPYRGSSRAYRSSVAQLVETGRTLVWVEDGEVLFKADLGSVALGVAQVQGVWLHPDLRGTGVAVPAMAAVVHHTLQYLAPTVTLYVNSFNAPALGTYRRVGFVRTGTFATVLL